MGIYLGADGGYHDDTDEMRELFPPAETTAELAEDALPDGEQAPFTESGELDGDKILIDATGQDPEGDTVDPAGDDADSGSADAASSPEASEVVSGESPKAGTSKTRK